MITAEDGGGEHFRGTKQQQQRPFIVIAPTWSVVSAGEITSHFCAGVFGLVCGLPDCARFLIRPIGIKISMIGGGDALLIMVPFSPPPFFISCCQRRGVGRAWHGLDDACVQQYILGNIGMMYFLPPVSTFGRWELRVGPPCKKREGTAGIGLARKKSKHGSTASYSLYALLTI